jgi:hypothetical protein
MYGRIALCAASAGLLTGMRLSCGRAASSTTTEASTTAPGAAGTSAAGTLISARAVAALSLPEATGTPAAAALSAGEREQAGAWAEALSMAGERIADDLGLEGVALLCYCAAGDLIAVAEGVA